MTARPRRTREPQTCGSSRSFAGGRPAVRRRQEVVGEATTEATGRRPTPGPRRGRGAGERVRLLVRFGGRHRDLVGTFSLHADRISNRIPSDVDLSQERWLLLGATFTHEYAVEARVAVQPQHRRLTPTRRRCRPGTSGWS